MRKVFNDATLQAEFEKSGYVVLQLLDGHQVATLAELEVGLEEAISIDNALGGTYVSLLDKNNNKRVSDAVEAVMWPALSQHLCDYRLLSAGIFLKTAQGKRFPTHQHPPFISDIADVSLACWCPLHSCDENNSVLQVAPGSHKLLWHIQTEGENRFFEAFADKIPEKYFVSFNLRPGQAVLFDDSLIHGSAPNPQRERRIAAFASLIPRDAVPAFFVKSDDPQDDGGFHVYAAPSEFCYADAASGTLPPRQKWELIASYPNRNVVLTEEQFCRLMANGERISTGIDPYQAVANLRSTSRGKPVAPGLGALPSTLARKALRKVARVLRATW